MSAVDGMVVDRADHTNPRRVSVSRDRHFRHARDEVTPPAEQTAHT
jgi:hypothetical protein